MAWNIIHATETKKKLMRTNSVRKRIAMMTVVICCHVNKSKNRNLSPPENQLGLSAETLI